MERRREPRSATQDSVHVRLGRRSVRCRMRNLSRSGCLIECSTMLVEVGTTLEVILGPDVAVTGEVAWQLGENFGVMFAEQVSDAVVREYAFDGRTILHDYIGGQFPTLPRK